EGEVEDFDVAAARHRQRPADVGPDHEGAVDGAGRERPLEDHLAAGKIAAALGDLDPGKLRIRWFLVAHLGSPFAFAVAPVQPTMNGSTDLRTVLALAGLANAPSGVIGSPSRVLSAEACLPSTLWIARAEASTSGLLMLAAWPR